jgi:rubrerythrin
MNIDNKELLLLSTKIEGEGKDFYTALATHIDDPEVKEFLLLMAREEASHEVQFRKLLEEKGDSQYGWENEPNLRSLINTHFQTDIFPRVDEIFEQLPKFQGIKKALNFAVDAEKISCEFYGLLQESCTDIETKTFMVLLEKVEQEHLERVELLRDRYLAKSTEDNPR